MFSLLIALATVGSALAGPVRLNKPIPDCGHHVAPRYMRPYNESEMQHIWRRDGTEQPAAGAKIRIHWMAVSQDDSIGGGNVPDEVINKQIELLNSDYAPTGFQFELTKIERVVNPNIFSVNALSGQPEVQLKSTIPTRDITLLKIWSMRPPNGMSYSHFPDEYASTPELDGVMYNVQSLEGGQPAHLLSHEVGHWTGLYHTFQGGCNDAGGGDQVADTPPHNNPMEMGGGNYMQCQSAVSTCNNGANDPNDNFMNYQNDQCRTQFSAGQIARMHTIMKQYRGLTPGAAGTTTPTSNVATTGSTTTPTTNTGTTANTNTNYNSNNNNNNNNDNNQAYQRWYQYYYGGQQNQQNQNYQNYYYPNYYQNNGQNYNYNYGQGYQNTNYGYNTGYNNGLAVLFHRMNSEAYLRLQVIMVINVGAFKRCTREDCPLPIFGRVPKNYPPLAMVPLLVLAMFLRVLHQMCSPVMILGALCPTFLVGDALMLPAEG
ncbi:hypothetical protein HGRIS_003086 [Hohenbuehelia grisea]|uniref:Peptidase M43 pregnancy-associated plasma-A domain-containing protein n=1 Tax=Hohenbuehelia grisea TaxID=104357 RepID=A0ABR3JNE4_9AGAR